MSRTSISHRRRRVQEGTLIDDSIPIKPQITFRPERLVIPAHIGQMFDPALDLEKMYEFEVAAVAVDGRASIAFGDLPPANFPDGQAISIAVPAGPTQLTVELRKKPAG